MAEDPTALPTTLPSQASGAAALGDAGGDEARPVRPAGPSAKAALFVLGVTLVVFVGGFIALALGPSTVPVRIATTVHTAPGSPLRAIPASTELRPMVVGGQPPSDILAALALPAGSTPVPGSLKDNGVALYDYSLGFRIPASQADVVAFFRDELKADGWQQISSGPRSGGPGVEILGQHGAVDGDLWDVGIVVSDTQFTSSKVAGGDVTPFTLELYIFSLNG